MPHPLSAVLDAGVSSVQHILVHDRYICTTIIMSLITNSVTFSFVFVLLWVNKKSTCLQAGILGIVNGTGNTKSAVSCNLQNLFNLSYDMFLKLDIE